MNKQKHNKHNCENFNFWLGDPRLAGQLTTQTSAGHTVLLKVRSLKAFNKLFLPAADILFQFQSPGCQYWIMFILRTLLTIAVFGEC